MIQSTKATEPNKIPATHFTKVTILSLREAVFAGFILDKIKHQDVDALLHWLDANQYILPASRTLDPSLFSFICNRYTNKLYAVGRLFSVQCLVCVRLNGYEQKRVIQWIQELNY